MLSERHADAVVVWAPAKVNLYLEVLAKRADGYHEIATLMVAVSLYDTLEFKEEATGEIRLACDDPDLSTGADNLVVRAAHLLRERTGCRAGRRFDSPNRFHSPPGWQEALPTLPPRSPGSTASGSSVWHSRSWRSWAPHSGVMWRSSSPRRPPGVPGRGEQVAPVTLEKALWFVLVCPPVGLSTAEVYRSVTLPKEPQTGAEILQAVREGDVEEIGRRLHNRLQPVALRLCPALADIEARLAGLRPAGQAMSGSGSSFFALCRDPREARRVAQGLRSRSEEGMNARVFIVRSCS